jgi:adenosine deaminase
MLLSSIVHADVIDHFKTIQHDRKALTTFFNKMPKGGELHYHLAGGAYPEIMLQEAAHSHYCLNPHTATLSSPPCHKDFDTSQLAVDKALYQNTLRAWSMQDFKAVSESGHDHFFASFFKFLPVVSDFPASLLADSMQRAASQHELYLEIIISPDNAKAASFAKISQLGRTFSEKKRLLLANPDFQKNIQHSINNTTQLLKDARHQLGCEASQNSAVCRLTIKFQYLVLREQPLDAVFAQALAGFEACNQSQELVGINLVQAEDGIISMRDYRAQMAIFNALHKVYPTVHIALHAGELTAQNRPIAERQHIRDAIVIGHAERIGHGVDILSEVNHNDLFQTMKTMPIPVEINLSSNRAILNIYGKRHPLRDYLVHQVPVILSTDDEGILRTNLTQQYVSAVLEHHLDYPTIKDINRNALTYSFLPGKSLWANPTLHIPVTECAQLSSVACQTFIQKEEKARLQWQLEQEMRDFEQQWTTSS